MVIKKEEQVEIPGLTEEQIEMLVKKVAELVMRDFYVTVGKGVVNKLLMTVGVVTVSILLWGSGLDKFIKRFLE